MSLGFAAEAEGDLVLQLQSFGSHANTENFSLFDVFGPGVSPDWGVRNGVINHAQKNSSETGDA